MERKFSRRDFLKVGGAGVAGVALVGAGGCGGGGSSTGGKKALTLGDIGWDEDVALNNVLKALLGDRFGYDVKLQLADAGPLYQGVSTGQIDAFMDTWLPYTQKVYWQKYKGKVEKLAPWYEGKATIGLAVPDYVEAKSIADLNKYRSQFGGHITGIEAGAGEMNVVKTKVIPGYHLDYTLQASSTPAMLSALKKAIANRKPIVVTLWKPHWAFTAYPIRYLEDPKGLMGKGEELSAIVSKNLHKDKPEAYAMIKAVRLTPGQLGELELEIRKSSPAKGARSWLKKNQSVVDPWIEAAKKAQKG
nr:glycine betaine ABC transporter substrate-binding protein [Rubrobacter naiadicus]